jgi:hypothetical protein
LMPKLRVSDHAMLRYLQRVGGFNIEGLRRQMELRVERIYAPGCASILIDGYRYLVKEGADGPVVVTVLDADRLSTEQLEARA